MRFPWNSRWQYKAAVFAILNVAAVVLLLLSPALASIYKTIMIALVCLFFVLWNAFFFIELYRQTQADKKMSQCLNLNDSYKHQLSDLRARQHDLKNQMAVIREMLDKNPAQNADIATFAQSAGDRIDEISMLLKLNNSAMDMLLYSKYKLAREKGIAFTLKSAVADFPYGPGLLYDLTAILGNIIDNAIESSAEGNKISVEIGEIQDYLYFSVTNHGNLPSQDIEKLFSPGFSTKGEGRGFGLSNVRSSVMKHGGNIELTAQGDRIECRVYFPVSA
jgi:two-component system, LytTR family, sensor histidine kinase AgrC